MEAVWAESDGIHVGVGDLTPRFILARVQLTPHFQTDWIVYAKPPFAGPAQVLDYVGRYTRRIALSNHLGLDMEGGHVRFRYKNYRANAPTPHATLTLTAREFIRRFLLRVLPPGFHRIRYYGFLGNRHRTEKLARRPTPTPRPRRPRRPRDWTIATATGPRGPLPTPLSRLSRRAHDLG